MNWYKRAARDRYKSEVSHYYKITARYAGNLELLWEGWAKNESEAFSKARGKIIPKKELGAIITIEEDAGKKAKVKELNDKAIERAIMYQ